MARVAAKDSGVRLKKYAKRGVVVLPKKWWAKCIGPASLKDPEHGYYSRDVNRKIGVCESCIAKIAAMRLSPTAENPMRGEAPE